MKALLRKSMLVGLLMVTMTSSFVWSAGRTETPEKQTVVFWHPYGEGSWTGEFIDRQIKTFNEQNPDIEVKSPAHPDYASIVEALQRSVAGKQLPSLATIGYGYDRYIMNSGATHPFDPYITAGEDYFTDFYPAVLDATTFDNKVYGIPLALSIGVVFYHPSVFTSAGLDPDNPPRTWAEFVSAARTIHDKLGIPGATFALDDPWIFESLVQSGGDSFIREDGTLGINGTVAKNLLTDWAHGTKDGYFLYNADFLETTQIFGAKQVGMMAMSSYPTVMYQGIDPEIRAAALPAGDRSLQPHSPIGGNSLYLFGNSEAERSAAVRFVEFMSSSENNADWAKNSGYLPTRQSSFAALEDFITGFDNYKTVVSLIGQVTPPTQWPERHVLRINQILMTAIEAAMLNTREAPTALDDAVRQIQPLL